MVLVILALELGQAFEGTARFLILQDEHQVGPFHCQSLQELKRRRPGRVELVSDEAFPLIHDSGLACTPFAAPVLLFPIISRLFITAGQDFVRDGHEAVEVERARLDVGGARGASRSRAGGVA